MIGVRRFRASSTVRAALLTVSTVALACSPAAPAAPTATSGGAAPAPAPTARPAVEQKLTYTPALFESNLHPWISLAGSTRRYDIYDLVVGQAADGSVTPAVATAWKSVDPTTWDLTIRQD